MPRTFKKKKNTNKNPVHIILMCAAVLFGLLMAIEFTRNILTGMFGWAVCVYIPVAFIIGFLLFTGRQPELNKKQITMLCLLFSLLTATLHVFFMREVIEGAENYLIASFKGYDTAGGFIFSLLTYPAVLITSGNYGISLAVFFILTATVFFFAIFPLVAKVTGRDEKKKKKSKLYVEDAEGEDESSYLEDDEGDGYTPREPLAPFDPNAFILKKGRTVKEVFSKPEERSKLEIVDALDRDTSAAAETKVSGAKSETYSDSISKLLGVTSKEEDYRLRYGDKSLFAQKPGRLYTFDAEDDVGRSNPIGGYIDIEEYEETEKYAEPVVYEKTPNRYEARYEPQEETPKVAEQPVKFVYRQAEEEKPQPKYERVERQTPPEPPAEKTPEPPRSYFDKEKQSALEYLKTPVNMNDYVGLFDMGETEKKPFVAEEEKPQVQPQKPEQLSLFNRTQQQTTFIPVTGKPYKAPPLDMFPDYQITSRFPLDYSETKNNIEAVLANYKINARVEGAKRGPTFSRYELKLETDTDVSKVKSVSLKDSLKMRLRVSNISLQAPIPGKDAVGIDIPNMKRDSVGLRAVIGNAGFINPNSGIQLPFGVDVEGNPFIEDLARLHHMLVAGASGSGKSVFINSLLMGIVYKYPPEDVRFLIIDPKKIDFISYIGLPHMLIGSIIKEFEQAANALKWLTMEMDKRYSLMESMRCNDFDTYNNNLRDKYREPKLPRLILIADEVGDLMLNAKSKGSQIEDSIVRIAQMGRACGIHLILGTQRPTADIITGNIKANILPGVSFSVKSGLESRIILDESGAENLLGKGDMLYRFSNEMYRLQAPYIKPENIAQICDYVRKNNESLYNEEIEKFIMSVPKNTGSVSDIGVSSSSRDDGDEELQIREALKFFIFKKKASITSLQSRFGVGFPKAQRWYQTLEERGYLTVDSAGRTVPTMTMEEFNGEFGAE